MKNLLILFTILICGVGFSQKPDVVKYNNLNIGEFFEFESEILNETRRVNVYLPLSYCPDSNKTYPVIYLLDGSMDEDFIHIAGLVQFCSFSWIDILPETIVVGISNVDRKRDFTFPTTIEKDKKDFPTTGGSQAFIEYLKKEVIPKVEERYKLNGDKTLIGQSLGGLLATEILFKDPEMFNRYLIVSPSLWWDNESLLELKPSFNNKEIVVAVGDEGKIMKSGAKKLYKKIKALDKSNAVSFDYLDDKDHGDVLHQAAYNGFQKLNEKEK